MNFQPNNRESERLCERWKK